MFKNSVKFSKYLSNLWMNISGIKWIVYQPKIFGIWSLFILFHLVKHWIVDTEMNTAYAYFQVNLNKTHTNITIFSVISFPVVKGKNQTLEFSIISSRFRIPFLKVVIFDRFLLNGHLCFTFSFLRMKM